MIEATLGLSAIILVVLSGLLILKQKKIVFWLAFAIAFMPFAYVQRYLNISGPINLTWVNFFLITGIGMVISVFKIRRMYIPISLLILYALILMIQILSKTLNHSSMLSFIFAHRNYIMLFAYFSIFRIVLNVYDKDQILGYMVNFGVASSLAAYFQRVFFVTLLGLGSGDMVTGLFFGDGAFLFFQLICLVTVFVYWFQGKKIPKSILPNPIAFFLMFSTLAIANNKAGLILFLAFVGLAAMQLGPAILIKNSPKIVAGAIAFILVFTVYESFHNAAYSDANEAFADTMDDSYSDNMTDPEFLMGYIFGDGTPGSEFSKGGNLKRGAAVVFAYDVIQKSIAHYLFGRGPGSTLQTQMNGATNYLDQLYPNYKIGRTTISFYLAENGILGIIFNVSFILALFFWKPPGVRREPSRFKIIRITFIFLSIVFLFYENLYTLPLWAITLVIMLYPTYPKPKTLKQEPIKRRPKPEYIRA